MIPYGKQHLDRSDHKAVLNVLKSNWLTQGPKVKEFENALANYCHAKYSVTTSSGTAALHLSYLAANLKPNDEVITSPNTFAATTNMLLDIGVKPVFCDIRHDTNNIDESKIEALITPQTKAIVPVHFAGHPCNMEKIWLLAKKYNLIVIEDAAHALGAKYKNTYIGSGPSDMTIFSFHPVKPITTGEGGAIITNNTEIYKKLITLRSHGINKDKNNFNIMTDLGYNYRLPDINAALGLNQLLKLEKFISLRQQIVEWYKKELKNITEILLPIEIKDVRSGWHLYVIRTKDPKQRLPLINHLRNANIGVNFHYPAVYSHPYYRAHGFSDFSLPLTDIYSNTAITIPIYPDLKKSDVLFITKTIKQFFYSKSHVNIFNQLAQFKSPSLREGHLFSFKSNLAKKTAENILYLLKSNKTDSLLDIGGGTGEISHYLAPHYKDLTISDGATNALSIAKKNLSSFPNTKFIHYNIIKDPIPFNKKQFNHILCYSVIQYLENKNQLQAFLKNFINILTPGGLFLIGDIPLIDKKEKYLETRRKRPLYNFIKTAEYVIKKYFTMFIYNQKNIPNFPNLSSLNLTETELRSYLNKHQNIKYRFIEQPTFLEHAGSRLDLLITKDL